MKNEKVWVVDEDYPAMTMDEMVENVTRDYARSVMNDAEFSEFCAKQDAMLLRMEEDTAAYAATHYFPGCYGDAYADC